MTCAAPRIVLLVRRAFALAMAAAFVLAAMPHVHAHDHCGSSLADAAKAVSCSASGCCDTGGEQSTGDDHGRGCACHCSCHQSVVIPVNGPMVVAFDVADGVSRAHGDDRLSGELFDSIDQPPKLLS